MTQESRDKKRKTDDKNLQQNFQRNIYDPGNMIFCDFCERELTGMTIIFCDDCKELDICVRCFALGQENSNHKKNHSYRVITKLDFPIFDPNWQAHEELLQQDGLEVYGFGNWTDISQYVVTKDRSECEIHYREYYMGKLSKDLEKLEKASKKQSDGKIVNIIPNNDDNTMLKKRKPEKEDSLGLKKPTTLINDKMDYYKETLDQIKEKNKNQSEQPFNEILGYMPLRGDFDVEFDNDAELFLAEMEFNDDDTEEEIDMKKKILEIYNKRQDERVKRKKFVIERGLLDLKRQSVIDRTRTKEEKEIYNVLKVFARFQTPEEHEKLVQNIVKERELRRRIEELLAYKRLGLKTFEDVEKFLLEKRSKDEQYLRRQKMIDSNNIYDPKSHPIKRNSRGNRDSYELKSKCDNKDNKASLTDQEIKLCENLGLIFHEYLFIKEVLVRESISQGFQSRSFAENAFKIDKERLMGVFDFLVSHDIILEK